MSCQFDSFNFLKRYYRQRNSGKYEQNNSQPAKQKDMYHNILLRPGPGYRNKKKYCHLSVSEKLTCFSANEF